MKFRTAYSEERVRVHAPTGSKWATQYSIDIVDGVRTVVPSGKENVYDSIQKSAPGNVIEDLIRRARNGDSSAIPQPVDSFLDLSHLPNDMLEAHMMLEKAHAKYEQLPLELRNRYDNSFEKFISAAASGKVMKDLITSQKPKTPPAPSLSADDISKLKNLIKGGDVNA